MCRLLLVISLALVWITAHGATNVPPRLELKKEPKFQSTPKYCLLTLGTNSAQAWMVEDGRRLYVDRNGNGDLTDDGPPIEPSDYREIGANRWDFGYRLSAIVTPAGVRHANLLLRRWNYGDATDSYGLSITVDGKLPMYAGWFGTFWSSNQNTAPVIHFAGPFTPRILRRDAFTIGERGQRLSLCFIHPGSEAGAVSRLSIEALPQFVVPELQIEWPTGPGRKPVRTSHSLLQRCCYWEFYTEEFALPTGVLPGQAKVSVAIPSAAGLELTTTEIAVPVETKPKPGR